MDEGEPRRDVATPGRAGDPRRRFESLRIGILFALFIVGLYLLRWWEPVDVGIIEPFTLFIASLSRWMLGIFGAEVAQDGTLVRFGDITLNILEECNGVPAILVFMSAILAYPAAVHKKLLGIAIGIPAIFIVNQIRVLSLFVAYRFLSPEIFNLLHIYVWQFVIITFAVLLWIYWAERFVRGPRTADPAP